MCGEGEQSSKIQGTEATVFSGSEILILDSNLQTLIFCSLITD